MNVKKWNNPVHAPSIWMAVVAFLVVSLLLAPVPALAAENGEKPSGPITLEMISIWETASGGAFNLSPDGRRLVFCMDKDGYSNLFVMDYPMGSPHQITAQNTDFDKAWWSPDSKRLAVIGDDKLWVMNADGSNPLQLTEYDAPDSEPRWSPDGKSIAFYSRRKGWDQIWVIRASGGEPRLVTTAPADAYNLSWSPDSRQVAYTVESLDDLLNADIWIAPVSGGEAVRLTEPDSSFDIAPDWSADGKEIAYVSDADGWDHIWLVDVKTHQRRQLTRGECEDASPRWSPDGKRIAFTRNINGRYHLMTVSPAGGEPLRVSSREGQHIIKSWFPDSTRILAAFSSPRHYPEIYEFAVESAPTAGRRITYTWPGGVNPNELVDPEFITFKARDGLAIHGHLYKPGNLKPGQRVPAIIYPHGGPTADFGYSWLPECQYLAQEGYAVFGIEFRGSTGYGKAFRIANFGEWGNQDLFDLVDGAQYLRSLDWIDGEHIGIYGGSYGGYMVLCAMARTPEVFACGVTLYGDSEIAESYRHGDRIGRLDLERQMGTPEENPQGYRRGSPLYYAEQVQNPILFLHGEEDMRVVPLMSQKMIEALKIENKFYQAHFYPGEGHGFRDPANVLDSYQRTMDFFERYLKN